MTEKSIGPTPADSAVVGAFRKMAKLPLVYLAWMAGGAALAWGVIAGGWSSGLLQTATDWERADTSGVVFAVLLSAPLAGFVGLFLFVRRLAGDVFDDPGVGAVIRLAVGLLVPPLVRLIPKTLLAEDDRDAFLAGNGTMAASVPQEAVRQRGAEFSSAMNAAVAAIPLGRAAQLLVLALMRMWLGKGGTGMVSAMARVGDAAQRGGRLTRDGLTQALEVEFREGTRRRVQTVLERFAAAAAFLYVVVLGVSMWRLMS